MKKIFLNKTFKNAFTTAFVIHFGIFILSDFTKDLGINYFSLVSFLFLISLIISYLITEEIINFVFNKIKAFWKKP